jgi:lipid-A-disaccharide synthase
MLAFLARRGAHVARLERALAAPRAVAEPPIFTVPSDRPLRILIACAEPSGELHAANLVGALRAAVERASAGAAPAPELVGLGGPRLAARGVRCIGDPVSRAAMGAEAARGVRFYAGLLRDVAAELRAAPFDVAIPVDSPALFVPLGRIARAYGVPVVHFITPQYWGWAPWRAHGYRGAVDLALSILPFEPAWFEEAGVPVAHVGHPLLDALPDVKREPGAAAANEPTLAVLPGSRAGVVDRHLPWMLAIAAAARAAVPALSVVLPQARAEIAERIAGHVAAAGAGAWARPVAGELHATLERSTAALSVSGTVLLDLLHHRLPAVVLYRVGGPLRAALGRRLLTVPWFASVNLLAGRAVYPEFGFHGAGPRQEVERAVVRALTDEAWRAACEARLDEAARRLGPPGAVARAAGFALATAASGGGAA